jgi:hypothetical protein
MCLLRFRRGSKPQCDRVASGNDLRLRSRSVRIRPGNLPDTEQGRDASKDG